MPEEKQCYLCGKEIEAGSMTAEHVLAKQFVPSIFRKSSRAVLFRLPAHQSCNASFQCDEDYFVMSLGPLSKETPAGKLLWHDLRKRIRRKDNLGLTLQVRREFGKKLPSGLILPHDKIVKKFDGLRIDRVIWKITRGLFLKIYGRILPEITPHQVRILDPQYPQPDFISAIFNCVKNQKQHGEHPGIFAYKFMQLPEVDDFHVWAMLFWDHLIFMVMFHDPQCLCSDCVSKNTRTAPVLAAANLEWAQQP